MQEQRKPLSYYLSLRYPFSVIVDPTGDYVITFPDLPGCMTQVDSLDNIGQVADEIRTLWLETAYEQGLEIPLPSEPEEYSGKFNVRLPKSLHRQLAEAAARDGVSLNQYVVAILAAGNQQRAIEGRLARIEAELGEINRGLRYHFSGVGSSAVARDGRTRTERGFSRAINKGPVAA